VTTMIPEKEHIEEIPKCEMCERKANPTIHIYKSHQLCSACFHQMQILPEMVADNLSRFLLGNVV
jgi:hypothetical protein